MSGRLVGGARVLRFAAVGACSLVLVAGCTRTADPARAPGGGGSEPVRTTEPAARPSGATGGTTDGATDGGASGGGGSSGESGGPGAVGGDGAGSSQGGGNQAPGSPIDVPTIPEKHQPMDGLRDVITGLFVSACGGTDLCVHLEFGDGACFVGYEPTTRAERGSTVRVVTESQEDCDRATGLSGSGMATDGTQGPEPSTNTPGTGPPDTPTDLPGSGATESSTGGASPDSGQPDGSSG
ncbi:hypothetical protein GCM10009740_18870 [Terrabacter terrae]|uniref:Uncharacterized protein n=1 Tax=Terrabacter terrae TaxID=318434 RepID=A0ABP5FQI9_9MICO